MPTQRFGLKLQRLRMARKLSRSALAKEAGITGTYVAKLERGGSDPTIGVLKRLATALDVPVTALLE